MKRNLIIVTLFVAGLLATRIYACGCSPTDTYDSDAQIRELAIQSYRDRGPAGLTLLLKHREKIVTAGVDANSPQLKLLDAAIDTVGGAKYGTRSRLYWHTDLEAAKQLAQAEKKPILSLRMLGNLSDDLSCANSRFFRTTLYANEQISQLLREKFVLHWQSVRPVPKITIDFGDGRKLERTITGNSVHYILASDGTVIDCLPGLYGPQAFEAKLHSLLKVFEALPAAGDARQHYLAGFHRSEEERIQAAWQADLARLRIPLAQPSLYPTSAKGPVVPQQTAPPRAFAANAIAMPKSAVELPALKAVVGRVPNLEQATTEQVWELIAKLHSAEAQLDSASRDLIASQNPTAVLAGKIAITKRRVENPLVKMLRGLEESIALDSVRNEYDLHRKLHRWFVEGSAPADLDALNDRVYAELFLMPKTDPWLGLLPPDAYSALPNNGVQVNAQVQ